MLEGYNQKYVPIASRIKDSKSVAYLKQRDMVYRIVLYDYRKRQFLQKIDIPENEDIQMMLNNRNVILRDAQMSIINLNLQNNQKSIIYQGSHKLEQN